MQKTYLHVALPDPRVSATSGALPNLCENHLTSAYRTSGAYRRKVRNADSHLPALTSRYTRTNLLPMLHIRSPVQWSSANSG
jgi:hypothetical protein